MASTVDTLKGGLVVAVCFVLLHSAMGQFNCSICTPSCNQNCQAIADSDLRKCSNISTDVFAACFKGCSAHCNGNSANAHRSCDIGSCSASSCGCPCARDCCNSCSNSAGQAAYQCTSAAGRVMQFCMPSCTNGCSTYCADRSAPAPAPAPAPTA